MSKVTGKVKGLDVVWTVRVASHSLYNDPVGMLVSEQNHLQAGMQE